MVHRESVEGYGGSLAQLAQDIGDLKYDSLAELLHLLAAKVERDGSKDRARGRAKLAATLQASADQIAAAAASIEAAWRISKPHMTECRSAQPEQ